MSQQIYMDTIRNFSIIAHIDHGKSTLADRMLEITGTIEKRNMQAQVLDSMELEREKGITIKMRPVRMEYDYVAKKTKLENGTEGKAAKYVGVKKKYTLNLIDTPGHIDFYYEVSRALKAVEGCLLLVDATQGIQAQTLTTLQMAKDSGLTIIPVLSKVDSPLARIDEMTIEICTLLGCSPDDVMNTSGKTGEGVADLLGEVIERIPAPVAELENEGRTEEFNALALSAGTRGGFRALVFDFQYSSHKGVIVYVRVLDGEVRKNDLLLFSVANEKFTALEVGIFTPDEEPADVLTAGNTGYIVTGIKKPGVASVGDTVTGARNPLPALHGYMQPSPVVWASIYPEDADKFDDFKMALGRLRLSDSSFTYEEEASNSLGRGFRCGFLGLLHLEIITERLKREFQLELVIATPSINYIVTYKDGTVKTIYTPALFPEEHSIQRVEEPWELLNIITPAEYVGAILQLLYEHEAEIGDSETFLDGRTSLNLKMPLRELMRNFFDELKSVSSGFASLSYEFEGMREADVVRLDILVADESIEAFCRVVSRRRVDEEAKRAVEKLHGILPRQMFTTKIQGKAMGRIIASESLSAMKKDVTQHMYGGDITRKMKLREKQKKGKKKMLERGRGNINIPHETFLKMMKTGDK